MLFRSSNRIGRTAQAKEFSREAVQLAVIAHIRHAETNYDELLMLGFDRFEARSEVKRKVTSTLYEWERAHQRSAESAEGDEEEKK